MNEDKNEYLKIVEFQTEDLDFSKIQDSSYLNNTSIIDNSYLMKSIDEDYVRTIKPTNPISFKDDQDKSLDVSNTSNYSLISENKLSQYAEKTKKLNISKITSFQSLSLKKQKSIVNKYDDEYKNIDDTRKAVFNACETISSNIQHAKNSPNNSINNSKGLSNPFNKSNRINKLLKNQTNLDKNNRVVKFEMDDLKDNNIFSNMIKNDVKQSSTDVNSNNLVKQSSTNVNSNNLGSEMSNNLTKNKFFKNEGNIENFIGDLEEKMKNNENNQINSNIDNKLRSLVTDTKINPSKVLKTGSLLSILNFGIKSNSILVGSKINVSEVS